MNVSDIERVNYTEIWEHMGMEGKGRVQRRTEERERNMGGNGHIGKRGLREGKREKYRGVV